MEVCPVVGVNFDLIAFAKNMVAVGGIAETEFWGWHQRFVP
jgi:hypothetical protein